MIVLAPASVQEMFEFTYEAFPLADKYRNAVMVLADGILGQMMEPIEIDTELKPCGIVEKPWAMTGAKARPGRKIRSLYLNDNDLEIVNIRLQGKYKTISENEVRAEEYKTEDADVIFVAYGTSSRVARVCVDILRGEKVKAGLIRPITLWPFPSGLISGYAGKGKKFFVLEMSSGQMVEDVRLAVQDDSRVGFFGRMGGAVVEEDEVVREVEKFIGKKGGK